MAYETGVPGIPGLKSDGKGGVVIEGDVTATQHLDPDGNPIGGTSLPGATTIEPNGLSVDGSFTAGALDSPTDPTSGIPHRINGSLLAQSYQGEYVNFGGPLTARQEATLSAEGGRLNPALLVSRVVDRTVSEQIQSALTVTTFALNDGPPADPSELVALFTSDLSQASINAAGMLGENGKTPPAAPAAITGNVTTGSLANLQAVVGQLLVALDAKGTITKSTT